MDRGNIEKLKFGDVVEVQAASSDIPESAAFDVSGGAAEDISAWREDSAHYGGIGSVVSRSEGNMLPTSLIHSTLKSLHDLGQAQYVVSVWICSAVPKLSGGLREGAYRDPVTVLWKQKMP
eukprot:gene28418-35267_t